MRRTTTPLILASAAFIAAGGLLHLREWLDTYRDVPGEAPGAFVVRVGFPVNAGLSLVVAAVLIATLFRAQRLQLAAVGGAFLFQAGSLAALIVSRVGSLLGWMEPSWTPGANQIRAVEIGALVCLAAVVLIVQLRDRSASTTRLAEA